MSEIKNLSTKDNWNSVQAYTLAVVCLLVGVAVGWLFRGSQSPVAAAPVENTAAPAMGSLGGSATAQPTPEQMKKMADTQATPLLEQLKSNPNSAELLASLGNIYYDTQQFSTAIDYYQRSLQMQPANAGVRTDMATAIWYAGDPDQAIQQFQKALTYEPNKANTLFNLGMVQWQGKMDVRGAIASWQKLLDTNPNYEGKEKVQEMIAQAKKHSDLKPGSTAKPLSP